MPKEERERTKNDTYGRLPPLIRQMPMPRTSSSNHFRPRSPMGKQTKTKEKGEMISSPRAEPRLLLQGESNCRSIRGWGLWWFSEGKEARVLHGNYRT